MSDEPKFPWRIPGDSDAEYYTAVGFLCQQWNITEVMYTYLASDIMRRPHSEHDLIFRHLGIIAISEFMAEYADKYIGVARTKEQLAYVTKYVDRCRINRNAIVHGWARPSEKNPGHINIVAKPDQRRPKKTAFFVMLKDIARVCDEIEIAGNLCLGLPFLFRHSGIAHAKQVIGESWQEGLFAKPALPKLVSVNPNNPQKQPVRPKSSRPKWRARQPRRKPTKQG
jgi:hypothetical protein